MPAAASPPPSFVDGCSPPLLGIYLPLMLAMVAGGLLVYPKRPVLRTSEPVAVDNGLGAESDGGAANYLLVSSSLSIVIAMALCVMGSC